MYQLAEIMVALLVDLKEGWLVEHLVTYWAKLMENSLDASTAMMLVEPMAEMMGLLQFDN